MKRLTPMLTLLTGIGMAAVLFTMSAQAAPPTAGPPPAGQAAAEGPAPSPPAADGGTTTPDPSVVRPGVTPPAAPTTAPTAAPGSPTPAPAPTTRAPRPTDAPAKVDVTWTGRLDNGATIAITATNGNATAYVCDGRSLEIWLQGTAVDGRLALTGGKGSRITGTVSPSRAAGTLTVGGRSLTFTAEATGSTKPAVYRASTQVRDAGVDGGWILLPDGSQIGVVTWNGTPVAAPPLDPAFFTTVVNGVGIDAVPVLPGPRTGGRG